jgi:glycosyltransferase involved in cell wall biosynthesis
MYLSIIIPAYNEEDRIVTTLNHTLSYLGCQEYPGEVLVISDGSEDNTKSVVENGFSPAEHVSLKVFEYRPNRGKGYAVRFGMLKGSGDRIMFMDADYSVPIEMLEPGMRRLDEGADIAIASRAVAGAVVAARQNFFRELSAKLYTFIQNRYLGIGYKDTQCGFKLFNARAARTLFKIQKLDSVIFDPEILWLAKRHQFKVAEFPVEWHHVGDSRIVYDSLQKSLFVFRELFRIRKLHRRP